jgi:hypothetical protein
MNLNGQEPTALGAEDELARPFLPSASRLARAQPPRGMPIRTGGRQGSASEGPVQGRGVNCVDNHGVAYCRAANEPRALGDASAIRQGGARRSLTSGSETDLNGLRSSGIRVQTSGRMLTWMAPGAPVPATVSNASRARLSGNVWVAIWSMGSLPEAMNWIASSTDWKE